MDLQAALAERLHAHEAQLQRHRDIVEKQRQWLLASAAREPPPTVVQDIQSAPHSVPPPKLAERSSSDASVPEKIAIEDRLLRLGLDQKKKLEAERNKREQERIAAEVDAMKRQVPPTHLHSVVHTTPRQKTAVQTTVLSGTPQISLQSAKIAEAKRAREGLQAVNIADSLLIRGMRSKEEAAVRREYLQNELIREPEITSVAKQLQRSGDVATRLFSRAPPAQEEAALRELIESSLEVSSPAITKRAKELKRREGHSACDDLYQDALRQKSDREEAIRQRATTPAPRCVPRIDPVSDLIAGQMENTSHERLLSRSKKQLSAPTYTFTPRISKESHRLASNRAGEKSRFEALHEDAARRSHEIQQRAFEETAEQLKNLTFSPAVSHIAKEIQRHEPLVTRVSQWFQRKQLRIEEAAAQKVNEEMTECTFAPAINVGPVFHSSVQEPSVGVDDFIYRQSEARARKKREAEAAEAKFPSGQHWRNNLTTPTAPNLGVRTETSVQRNSGAREALMSAMAALRTADEASRS